MMSRFQRSAHELANARFARRFLIAALLCLLSSPVWAQASSGFERTIPVGNTKVTCRYTVGAISVDSSRVADATASVKCWIPDSSPGRDTTLSPSNVSASMKMYRDNIAFTGNSMSLLNTTTASPQIAYNANETPPTCTKGRKYTWQATFVVSFTLKLAYNGQSVSFPQQSVNGPVREWAAVSSNCN